MKTIKALSEEFGVSKQAIRKQLTEDFRANYVQTVTSNGVQTLFVSNEGYFLLKQHFSGGKSSHKQAQTVTSNPLDNELPTIVTILEQQLQEKDRQLKTKDEQIERLQKLLDQQQQLTLQTNKQVEQLSFSPKTEKESYSQTEGMRENFSEKEKETSLERSDEEKKKRFWNKMFRN